VWMLLQVSDELAKVGDAKSRIHREDQRRGADLAHRHQVFHRLESCFRREQWIDEDARRARDEEGVAIGLALRHELGGDARAGARLVLHHHRLAERAAERLLESARDEVGGAAGREADHQAHRLRGIGLRKGLRREQEKKDEPHSAPSTDDSKAPSLGGLASTPTFTPASRSAADATGPMEATSVRFSGPCTSLFSCFETRNRFRTCSALVNSTASISPRSSRPTSSASSAVSCGSDQR